MVEKLEATRTFPVWPTCSELSAYPASTAARDAPIAGSQAIMRFRRHGYQTRMGSPAPRLSAKGSITAVNCSADLRARPPETTREAEDKSGLLDVVSSSDTNLVGPVTKKSRCQRTSRYQAVGTTCDDILLPGCAVISSTSALEPPNFALSNAVVRTLTIPTLSLSWLVLICKIAFPA